MQFTTADKIKLTYTDQGSGPAIILLSGYSGIKEEWQQQIPFFVAHGYRVIAYDARNHGRSQRRQQNLKIARLGQDLAELINYLKLKQIILVGHSMGAATIWAYCMLHSDKYVTKIITIDESPYPLNTDTWIYGAQDLTWDNVAVNAPTIMQTKMAQAPINATVKNNLRTEHTNYPFDFEGNQTLLRNHLTQDWRDLLATLHVPQLYLAGGKSPLWSAKHAQSCVQLAQPGLASSYVFANAGHLPHLEFPSEFNNVMLNFLNQKNKH